MIPKLKKWPPVMMFMRHGAAVDGYEFPGPDAARPLQEDGRLETARVARRLLTADLVPQLFIASDLVRAQETAQVVREACVAAQRPAGELLVTEHLRPETTAQAWYGYLGQIAPRLEGIPAVLVVGHRPSLEYLVASHLGIGFPIFSLDNSMVAVVRPHAADAGRLLALLPPCLARATS